MRFYEKISFLLAFLTAAVIFLWSAVPGLAGPAFGTSLLAVLYHIGMFALLSAFLFLGIWERFEWKWVILIFGIVLIFAQLDELHQYFVPGRSCNLFDLTINFTGLLFGLLFTSFFKAIRRK